MTFRQCGPIRDGRPHRSELVNTWVNFNAAITIAASENVSSLTDNGTGNWTVTFAVAQASADSYMVLGSTKETAVAYLGIRGGTAITAGSVNVQAGSGTGTLTDPTDIYVAIIGD